MHILKHKIDVLTNAYFKAVFREGTLSSSLAHADHENYISDNIRVMLQYLHVLETDHDHYISANKRVTLQLVLDTDTDHYLLVLQWGKLHML